VVEFDRSAIRNPKEDLMATETSPSTARANVRGVVSTLVERPAAMRALAGSRA
jgi:hypothetical protein